MSLQKPQQNLESIRESSPETLKVDLALEIKEERNAKYTELITSIDKKYGGKYEFAANILKRYIKNEILALSVNDNVVDFTTIADEINSTVTKFNKFFDSMLRNLSNSDFAKKLGLKSASIDAGKVLESAVYNGVTNKYQMAILKIYSMLKFSLGGDQNFYLTDIFEEEIKALPLEKILKKFDQLMT